MSAADPWSFDYFSPPNPGVAAPSPRVPKAVPGMEDLFRVQRNALKTLNALDNLEHALGKDNKAVRELDALRKEATGTYKVIRTYLSEHNA